MFRCSGSDRRLQTQRGQSEDPKHHDPMDTHHSKAQKTGRIRALEPKS